MAGRIGWSSTSDLIGRKNIYRVYLGVGALMYLAIALLGDSSKPLFILCALVILSFYGGGFATVPAYLKDLFGTYQVGAIHGRLLTAWSTAGVLGPLIVNWVADRQEEAGRSGPALYGLSLVIMIGLLVVGFVANELVRPVHPQVPRARGRRRRGREGQDRRRRPMTTGDSSTPDGGTVRRAALAGAARRPGVGLGRRTHGVRALRTDPQGRSALHRLIRPPPRGVLPGRG